MSGFHYAGRYTWFGPPGTGKTTMLARQVRAIVEQYKHAGAFGKQNPVLICSLTRTAAAEIGGRDLGLSPRMVGTLHAHCFRALGTPRVLDRKAVAAFNDLHPSLAITPDEGLDEEDLLPGERPSATPADRFRERYDLYRHRMIPRDRWLPLVTDFAEKFEAFKIEHECVDFTDMIELCADGHVDPPGDPAVVIADEAQDFSRLEYNVVSNWGDAAGALMIVGDPWQTLYEWRGADPHLFDDPTSQRKVLRQSYRVPRRVRDAAIGWVRRNLSTFDASIEYEPRDEEGQTEWRGWKLKDPSPLVTDIIERSSDGESCMVCAACDYMLKPVLNELRAAGVPYANPWRRKRGDWNPLWGGAGVRFVSRLLAVLRPLARLWGEERTDWTNREILYWTEALKQRGILKYGVRADLEERAKSDPDGLNDPAMLRSFMDDEPAWELLELYDKQDLGAVAGWWRDRLLAKFKQRSDFPMRVLLKWGIGAVVRPPNVYIGTIHSFKGAEADNVYVSPDVSPATQREIDEGKMDPTARLFYVAMTRARRRLVVLDTSGGHSVDVQAHVL